MTEQELKEKLKVLKNTLYKLTLTDAYAWDNLNKARDQINKIIESL